MHEHVAAAAVRHAPAALQDMERQRAVSLKAIGRSSHRRLTSCRQAIKAIADALYPASKTRVTGDDGVPRSDADAVRRVELTDRTSLVASCAPDRCAQPATSG
jgi:hypothetical protein